MADLVDDPTGGLVADISRSGQREHLLLPRVLALTSPTPDVSVRLDKGPTPDTGKPKVDTGKPAMDYGKELDFNSPKPDSVGKLD